VFGFVLHRSSSGTKLNVTPDAKREIKKQSGGEPLQSRNMPPESDSITAPLGEHCGSITSGVAPMRHPVSDENLPVSSEGEIPPREYYARQLYSRQ